MLLIYFLVVLEKNILIFRKLKLRIASAIYQQTFAEVRSIFVSFSLIECKLIFVRFLSGEGWKEVMKRKAMFRCLENENRMNQRDYCILFQGADEKLVGRGEKGLRSAPTIFKTRFPPSESLEQATKRRTLSWKLKASNNAINRSQNKNQSKVGRMRPCGRKELSSHRRCSFRILLRLRHEMQFSNSAYYIFNHS